MKTDKANMLQNENIDVSKSDAYNKVYAALTNKWEHISYTDEELKQIAKDIYHDKIFTNRHIQRGQEYLISSIFMVVLFMGHINWPTDETRESKLIRIFLEDLEVEHGKRYNKWINEVGLFYEYYSDSSPCSINSYPTFISCRFLSKTDTDRMNKFYDIYVKMQNDLSNNF